MPYLTDGNNIMGASRQAGLIGPDRRAGLVKVLQALARQQGGRYVVVFDGPPGDGFADDVRLGSVEVVFGGRLSADEIILQRLRKARTPGDWTVITADRSLATRSRHLGAAVLTAAELLRKISRLARADGNGKESAPEGDLEDWENYFRSRKPDDENPGG